MNKLSKTSRIILAIASLSLVATYFLPVWFIYLLAPQYPEGLTMYIWLNNITGEVDIINGLNHYIGMKHISVEMFPEFTYLIYIVGFFIALGLLVAITGNKKLHLSYLVLTVLAAVAALYDFYRWGYDYGHNLDPKAAIQVPGLSYQPPVIGHKTLLNFDAYSYPDWGGWIFILSGMIFFAVYYFEWRRSRKRPATAIVREKKLVPAAAMLILVLASCNTQPKPFQYGKDMCDECRMTIIEPAFGGQVITKKGKVYKFDDMHCLVKFYQEEKVKEADIAHAVFIDYSNPDQFLDVKSAWFVTSPQLKSPMNSNAASFSSKEIAEAKAIQTSGSLLQWNDLVKAGKK